MTSLYFSMSQQDFTPIIPNAKVVADIMSSSDNEFEEEDDLYSIGVLFTKTLINALEEDGPENIGLRGVIYTFKLNDIGMCLGYDSEWSHRLLGQVVELLPDKWQQWFEDNYGAIHELLINDFSDELA